MTQTCREVKNILIEKYPDYYTAGDQYLLDRHLPECEICRALHENIGAFNASMDITKSDSLEPDPAIRRTLIARLKHRKPQVSDPWERIHDIINGFVRFKIPAYQAALGVVLFFVTFSIFHRHKASNHPPSFSRSLSSQYGSLTSHFSNFVDSLHSQKIGRNILEDSALFKIITLTATDRELSIQKSDTAGSGSY